ncbi:Hypothetical protein I596_319 [Dokdonella koreensis DS-123]|uniref:Uncharacterized protein n=1 Tax=Dokdonella koreensis DS-123 TaxID=1300342 RepID=A0A167GAZ0_9GAMM|nr:Hypothetical protein I596_319 [Dokdonella koreensis DS-123]
MDVERSAKAPGAVIRQGAARPVDRPSGPGLQRRRAPRPGLARRVVPSRWSDRVAHLALHATQGGDGRLTGTAWRHNAAHLNVHDRLQGEDSHDP